MAIQSTKDTNLIEANHKDRFVPLVFYEYRADEPEKFKKVVRAKVDIEKLQNAAKEGTLTDREKRALKCFPHWIKNTFSGFPVIV